MPDSKPFTCGTENHGAIIESTCLLFYVRNLSNFHHLPSVLFTGEYSQHLILQIQLMVSYGTDIFFLGAIFFSRIDAIYFVSKRKVAGPQCTLLFALIYKIQNKVTFYPRHFVYIILYTYFQNSTQSYFLSHAFCNFYFSIKLQFKQFYKIS